MTATFVKTSKTRDNAQTIKTTLHVYSFDISKPDEREAWEALKKKLRAMHGEDKLMESWGGDSHYLPWVDRENGSEVELSTAHIFNNQWNTETVDGEEKGYRVFDWALDYTPTGMVRIKRGHYLVKTPEFDEIKKVTKCGYCGAYGKPEDEGKFCSSCLESQYLNKEELHLLRLQKISDTSNRAPLTDEERAVIVPMFVKAQSFGVTKSGKAAIKKKKDEIKAKAKETIKHARIERDGMLWLINNGIKTDNVIYYRTNKQFSFGWRRALSPEEATDLHSGLNEFPFNFEIKLMNGKIIRS